jgi:gas vesicle protein
LSQFKIETSSHIENAKNEILMDRSAKDQKILDRVDKVDINGERALDEIYSYKEQLRQLGEERKRDIEETADFIKQLIDQNKEEWQKETSTFSKEIDHLKKEMVDRCTLKELLGLKQ